MAYSDSDGTKRLMPKLTSSDVSDADINIELERVATYINSVLSRIYTVPFVQVGGEYPPLIVSISEELSLYCCARIVYHQHQTKKNEWVESFRDSGEKKLEMLLAGELTLLDSTGTVIVTTGVAFKSSQGTTDATRIFGFDEYYDGMTDRLQIFEDYDDTNL